MEKKNQFYKTYQTNASGNKYITNIKWHPQEQALLRQYRSEL